MPSSAHRNLLDWTCYSVEKLLDGVFEGDAQVIYAF